MDNIWITVITKCHGCGLGTMQYNGQYYRCKCGYTDTINASCVSVR